jgi:hypothetical protein
MNLDECFGKNNKEVLSIHASYYSELEHEFVVKQGLPVVNANKLIEIVTHNFEKYDIPLSQLISNISDSTNYMRGQTAGFETLLRREAPHLLDIDVDICRNIHNAAQMFCRYFSKIVKAKWMISILSLNGVRTFEKC